MKVGAILPHCRQFGGVRRFMEIGNVMTNKGIDYTIYVRGGSDYPTWFNYKGKIKAWPKKIKTDYLLIGDPPCFKVLKRVKGKIFIYVIAGGRFKAMYKKQYKKHPFIINNRVFKQYFPKSHLIEGGVNIHTFKPTGLSSTNDKPKVLYYDGAGRHKGAPYIRQELSNIKGINLVGLRGLGNKDLVKAYQEGDFFVSWESRAGWSNCSAEALACGLTVVTNGTNCQPFIDKVIRVKKLKEFFSHPANLKIRKIRSMSEFSWEKVTDKLLKIFKDGK